MYRKMWNRRHRNYVRGYRGEIVTVIEINIATKTFVTVIKYLVIEGTEVKSP